MKARRFNSRTPGGVRRRLVFILRRSYSVSIHAPREGCDIGFLVARIFDSGVSIHAPREGCDFCQVQYQLGVASFNSRTPGGVRPSLASATSEAEEFQFTHPGRGATTDTPPRISAILCFNSRTPGGVRQYFTPLEVYSTEFQFTHPGRGATKTR